MRPTTLIQIVALPSILANILGVDIVATPGQKGMQILDFVDEHLTTMTAAESNGHLWCLTDGEWTYFCGDKKNKVQVYGHIDFAEPTKEPRRISHTAGGSDGSHYCELSVTSEEDMGNLVWDVQRGLLDYNLRPGYFSSAINFTCDYDMGDVKAQILGDGS